MFAVVTIAGFQEIVTTGLVLKVPTLAVKEGEKVTFDNVLLMSKDGTSADVGMPHVAGAKITAVVKSHGKGDKIVVRKFKRRKRYHKVLRGHRQGYTEIEVLGIEA